jgi:hypothetical protein
LILAQTQAHPLAEPATAVATDRVWGQTIDILALVVIDDAGLQAKSHRRSRAFLHRHECGRFIAPIEHQRICYPGNAGRHKLSH